MDLLPLALQGLSEEASGDVLRDVILTQRWAPFAARWLAHPKLDPRHGCQRGAHHLTRRAFWDTIAGWSGSRVAALVVAVLLFGDWSADRWPLRDDAYEMRLNYYMSLDTTAQTITGLEAWVPSTAPGALFGINREPERRLSAIVAPTEEDMRRLAIGEAPQVDTSFLRDDEGADR